MELAIMFIVLVLGVTAYNIVDRICDRKENEAILSEKCKKCQMKTINLLLEKAKKDEGVQYVDLPRD